MAIVRKIIYNNQYFYNKEKIIFFLLFLNLYFFSFITAKKPTVEKKIVVILCFYNVQDSIKRTLKSVLNQTYNNYRLILVNDASTDQTECIVQQLLKEPPMVQYTYVQNLTRKRKLANLYAAIHNCDDDDIIFLLDGDDWLINDHVFLKINEVYHDESIWMTYGNYKNVPKREALLWNISPYGNCREVSSEIINKQLYRKMPFVYMHPRTFYAWLFKKIKREDLICKTIEGFIGDFFPACNDQAMLFPMVEMAGNRTKFISDILYCRNIYSTLVGFKVDKKLQVAASNEIRAKSPYSMLTDRVIGKGNSFTKYCNFLI